MVGRNENLGITQLVEQKMRDLESTGRRQHKRDEREPSGQQGGRHVKFYLAISRECGCGAEALTNAIQEKTGFEKFDHEILDYMAEHDDVRRRLYETIDDRTMGWIESICSSLSMGPAVDHVEYFNRLSHGLLAICHNTHAIIIGRAANFILPRNEGLAVRLVAPRDYRLQRYAARHNLDLKTALREMERIDRGRGSFVEAHFGKFAFDPRRYDLTINVSQFSQAQIVEMILLAMKAKAGKNLKLPVK